MQIIFSTNCKDTLTRKRRKMLLAEEIIEKRKSRRISIDQTGKCVYVRILHD